MYGLVFIAVTTSSNTMAMRKTKQCLCRHWNCQNTIIVHTHNFFFTTAMIILVFLWSITIILFRKTFAVLVEVCNGLHNEFFTVFIIEMMFSQMCQNKQNSHKTLGLAQNKGLALSWNPTIPAKPFFAAYFCE